MKYVITVTAQWARTVWSHSEPFSKPSEIIGKSMEVWNSKRFSKILPNLFRYFGSLEVPPIGNFLCFSDSFSLKDDLNSIDSLSLLALHYNAPRLFVALKLKISLPIYFMSAILARALQTKITHFFHIMMVIIHSFGSLDRCSCRCCLHLKYFAMNGAVMWFSLNYKLSLQAWSKRRSYNNNEPQL